MILVAGGTGTLGTALVDLLAAHGDPVRVLTRDGRRTALPHRTGVDVVTGDIRDPASVVAAVAGVTSVVSAIHGFTGGRRSGPAAIDRDGNRSLIRAAVDAGVDHLVLVSVNGAAVDHPMSLHRMKYAAEQALIGSGLRWTIIRPVPFLETWLELIGAQIPDRGRALVFGRGDNPINFVSVHDVAAAVHEAIHDRASSGRLLDVTGPENLTFNEIARRLIAATDRPGRTAHVPRAALRLMATLAKPVAPAFARQARAAVVMDTIDMTTNDPARSSDHGDPTRR
jgi:uncharacterized protein YbjT (DUF2867 family)